ncbi:hypothetical protein AC579_9297 [Pseudocercospora musae]|uniref:Uncharacterized protein n=1 Tax=Pseudocercospora musae TaxID=113226 RepID=A0A139I540_9PEZI|nr:hypothetical protein AC579_9297 [Pseudocercospora musae]
MLGRRGNDERTPKDLYMLLEYDVTLVIRASMCAALGEAAERDHFWLAHRSEAWQGSVSSRPQAITLRTRIEKMPTSILHISIDGAASRRRTHPRDLAVPVDCSVTCDLSLRDDDPDDWIMCENEEDEYRRVKLKRNTSLADSIRYASSRPFTVYFDGVTKLNVPRDTLWLRKRYREVSVYSGGKIMTVPERSPHRLKENAVSTLAVGLNREPCTVLTVYLSPEGFELNMGKHILCSTSLLSPVGNRQARIIAASDMDTQHAIDTKRLESCENFELRRTEAAESIISSLHQILMRSQPMTSSPPLMTALSFSQDDQVRNFSYTMHHLRYLQRPARLLPQTSRQLSLSSAFRERNPAPPNPVAPRASAPSRSKTQLPLLPLIAIFCLGTGSFYFLTKSRASQTPSHTYELPDRDPGREQWPRTPRKE